MDIEQDIFREGSQLHYNAARFFPKNKREDVSKLYSFLHVTRGYVNAVPVRAEEFRDVVQKWRDFREIPVENLAPDIHDSINARIVKNICYLIHKYDFDRAWVEAFLYAMHQNTIIKDYRTIAHTLAYVHGSAEVVGLMLGKIAGLPDKALPFMAKQARAMQYLDFLRDIAEENLLGRRYFPASELKKYRLPNLQSETALKYPNRFRKFVYAQLERYNQWQMEAEEGLDFLPKRLRVAVMTAADGYDWAARIIAKDPQVIFERKVRPSKAQVITTAVGHIFD